MLLLALLGIVDGTVLLQSTQKPLHHATVVIPALQRITETDDNGKFQFKDVPQGRYDIIAHASGLTDSRKTIDVKDHTTVDFAVKLMVIRQEITVTASGRAETTLEAMNSVATLDTLDLASKNATSLGDVLDGQPGVHKRSFGPGSTRPVLRGFDGDRVLVMQDGVRTGTVSSMSGDHGEPVDPQSLERIEVVRGPATLLYGSNAIGGVVNMITDHHQGQTASHDGVHGYISTNAGSNNGMHGASAGVSVGMGPWVGRLSTGGTRTSDYDTARERILNSASRALSGSASLSRYADKGWFTMGYNTQRGQYEVPSDEAIALPYTRQNVRIGGGLRDKLDFSINHSNWRHDETHDREAENEFHNSQTDLRLVAHQRRRSFGAWALHRDYKAIGEEAITPPVSQNSFAVFGVETMKLERAHLQLGGRVENTRYGPEEGRKRGFTGFSGSAGINVPLWNGGAFVSSFNHSFRAPALEELYANGPHPGNLTYEVGDTNLKAERANGVDIALRHTSPRMRAEATGFYYNLKQFVFLAPTGHIEDGFVEAEYKQAAARYAGFEGRVQSMLHQNVWLQLAFDAVDAQLTLNKTSLPRIPPIRGRTGIDVRWKALSINPELVLANRQSNIFQTETPTAGYATANVKATYTLARQHTLHLFSVNWFNANNRFYRNHLSFIKDTAAEIGRGVAFNYTVRFY